MFAGLYPVNYLLIRTLLLRLKKIVSILTRSPCEACIWILTEPKRIINACWRYHNFHIAYSCTCFSSWACVIEKASDFVVRKKWRCARAPGNILYLHLTECQRTASTGINSPTQRVVLFLNGWCYSCELSCARVDVCEDFIKRTRLKKVLNCRLCNIFTLIFSWNYM